MKEVFELYIKSEVFYISSKICEPAGLEKPNVEALNVKWLKTKTQIRGINEDLALEAEELKKKLHIALPDYYVIVKVENEMKPILRDLRKLNFRSFTN